MHEELGTGPGFFYLWDKAVSVGPRAQPEPAGGDDR